MEWRGVEDGLERGSVTEVVDRGLGDRGLGGGAMGTGVPSGVWGYGWGLVVYEYI